MLIESSKWLVWLKSWKELEDGSFWSFIEKKEDISHNLGRRPEALHQCESLLPVGRVEIPNLILKGGGACVGWNFDLLKEPLFEDLCNPPADLADHSQSGISLDVFFLAYQTLVCRLTSIQKRSPRLYYRGCVAFCWYLGN